MLLMRVPEDKIVHNVKEATAWYILLQHFMSIRLSPSLQSLVFLACHECVRMLSEQIQVHGERT